MSQRFAGFAGDLQRGLGQGRAAIWVLFRTSLGCIVVSEC